MSIGLHLQPFFFFFSKSWVRCRGLLEASYGLRVATFRLTNVSDRVFFFFFLSSAG